MGNSSKTDWARVDALSDEQIDTSDIPPLDAAALAKGQLRLPSEPTTITLQIEQDVLDWFRQTGPGWQQRAAAALRLYATAHRG